MGLDLKRFVKRVTHRVIPYLILFEAIFVLWLYFNEQTTLTASWYLFALGFGSLVVLAALEHRQDLPLPFMNHLPTKDFLKTFALALVVSLAVMVAWIVAPVLLQAQGTGITTLTSFIYYEMARSANAGIMEESDKLAFTNLAAMAIQKALRKRGLQRLNRVALYIIVTITVALWAWGHVYLTHYPIGSVAFVFVGGMVYFELIIRKRNYLPTVLAHMSYNDLAVFLSLFIFHVPVSLIA